MQVLGDFRVNATVRLVWNTNAVAGESITRATNGSIRIYKNGSTTERTSSAGITDTEDFDTLTGVHHLSIDLSDNTDAGFYAAGNDYFVVLQGATIDGKAINAALASFSIENRNPQVDVTKFGGTAGTFSGGRPEVNATHWGGTAVASANVRANLVQILGTAPTEGGGGRLAGAFTTLFDVAAPVLTTASVNQTGDSFARLGAPAGASISADVAGVQSDTNDIQTRLPAALVGGRMDSDVGALQANVITSAAIATAAFNSSKFNADTGFKAVRTGAAQAGAASTITLDTGASATNDFYNNMLIVLTANTGAGQARAISDYVGGTKVATVDRAWITNPDATTTFAILPAASAWDHLRADHAVSGSFGEGVASVQGNVTGNVAGSTGSVTGAVGSVTGSVGSVTGDVGGNVVGSVGSLATQAKADVNAEVVDAVNVDTYAEPGQEAPPATTSIVKKIGYLYKFLRNRIVQTSSQLEVYADNGTTLDQKASVSDDGTSFVRGKIGTGP